MLLRLAVPGEFYRVRNFYWELIDLMADREDSVGWKKGIYPCDAFLRESLAGQELYVLEQAGKYAACVILNSDCNDGYAGTEWQVDCAPEEVLIPHALGVHPSLQGRGIGRAVLEEIIALATAAGKKAIRLDILARNVAAERLYTGRGFRFIATKKMFYEDTGWTEFKLYEMKIE